MGIVNASCDCQYASVCNFTVVRIDGSSDTWPTPVPLLALAVGMLVLNWKDIANSSLSRNSDFVPRTRSPKPPLPPFCWPFMLR